MSDMPEQKPKRMRRSFTDEFKAEVVKKVLSSGKSAGQVAYPLVASPTFASPQSSTAPSLRLWPPCRALRPSSQR